MNKSLQMTIKYSTFFAKWLVIAVITGLVGALVGSFFHHLLDIVTNYREQNTKIIYFLPLAGLLIAAIYAPFKKKGSINTDRIIKAADSRGDVPLVTVPLIFISTIITHLFGGSAGREGAALQIGGGLGYNLGKVFRLSQNDRHIITMAGMGSVFASLFMTPVTGAVFAIEVAFVGTFNLTAFLPCIIASGTSVLFSSFLGVEPSAFELVSISGLSSRLLINALIVGAVCALVSIVFCVGVKKSEEYFKKLLPNSYLRILVGGIIVVLLTLVVGTYDYNGAGMGVVMKALSGEARPYDFIVKIIFTAITIGAGFKGGEIVPSFFIGATLGCIISPILGLDPSVGAAIGMTALFCGVVNCPIASLVLSAELFGAEALLVFAIACATSYILSGNFSLYKEQHFVFSKFTASHIK